MKMRYLGALLAVFLLVGAGCSSVPEDQGQDSYYYDGYEDSYDDYEYYDYSSIPQGYHDVYACNLTSEYCEYLEVKVEEFSVTYVYRTYAIYPSDSYCDERGCYFVDDFGADWIFDF